LEVFGRLDHWDRGYGLGLSGSIELVAEQMKLLLNYMNEKKEGNGV
jgi:hypothetical protein